MTNPSRLHGREESDGRFRVVRELGRGGMGVVMLVDDALRGQRLALKRIRYGKQGDLRQFKREFRAIEQIHHPSIVAVYELGIDDQGPYLLMEAISGTDFCSWCRSSVALEDPVRALEGFRTADSGVVGFEHSGTEEMQAHTFMTVCEHASRQGWAGSTLTLGHADPIASSQSRCSLGHGPIDAQGIGRLRATLPRLLGALSCLHEHGLVHRDLKPANVLVGDGGSLKVLDFGIFGEVGAVPVGAILGTVAYVAPEQIRGEPPIPANDLYSLGVMLFETITGHLPFVGPTRTDVLTGHLFATAPPVRSLAPDCPDWLAFIVQGLLAKNVEGRLSLSRVFDVAAPYFDEPAVAVVGTASPVDLVERTEELTALTNELDAASRDFRFVAVCGASGLGKSVLLDRIKERVRQRGFPLFQSRVRFSERVPFNAMDGIVDELAAFLERTPGLLTPDGERALKTAAVTFPSLGRGNPGHSARMDADAVDVFDAVFSLMEQCGRGGKRVVLVCDDLQWADADSVGLIQRMLARKPEGLLFVAAVRDDTHTPSFARLWAKAPIQRLELERMSEAGLASIITRVAADAGCTLSADAARAAASSCDGRPFLAVVSGRVAARGAREGVSPDEPMTMLVREYADLGRLERRLLSLLASLERRAELRTLAALTSQSGGAVDDALAPLVRERLVRVTGAFSDTRWYEFVHDLVRRQAIAHLDPGDLGSAHADIAEELVRSGARPGLVVPHLLASDQFVRAAALAEESARDAEATNAFGLAADLYEVAIAHSPNETARLREARAVALERSGRYLDAASEWKRLADQSVGKRRIDALINQAKAFLATQHIAEGRRTLDLARREAGHRPGLTDRLGRAAGVMRFIAGPSPFTRLRVQTQSSSPAAECDVFLGTMIGYFDPLDGIRHLLKARRSYVREGVAVQAAEVEYVLAYLAYFAQARCGRVRLAERYLQSARRRFGGDVTPGDGRPYALDWMVQGVAALHRGDWQAAESALETSATYYEAVLGRRGSFEHQFVWIQRLHTAQHRQDLAKLQGTVDVFRRVAQDGQASAAECHLNFADAVLALLKGDAGAAREMALAARSAWPQEEPSFQRFLSHFQALAPERYLTDGVAAWKSLKQAIATHGRFMPLRNMLCAEVVAHLALFEAMALRRRVAGASFDSVVRLARTAGAAPPLGRHMAFRAAAYAADSVGRPEEALEWLIRAEYGALGTEQHIDVAIARYQRGIRLGGEEGQTLVDSARSVLAVTGVHALLLEEDVARR